MPALCRDCHHLPETAPPGRCPVCRSPRIVAHPELDSLAVAHVDCDAFYAAVEIRDDPSLADRPLIVGGGRRGVVTTCCYLARIAGVRSAMPMFKALKLCPDARVVRPRMEVYAAVSREIRARMDALTPLVEPLSLDEAFLDLSGTERLLGATPARSLARLASRIEAEIGITVSVGLSHNKFLAKIASDLDKPRGFSAIGRAETLEFLAPRPVRSLWGVGASLAAKLEAAGIHRVADLRMREPVALAAAFGQAGPRLHALAHGIDPRPVSPDRPVKSVSTETTFEEDIGDADRLDGHLWRLAVKVSDRAKAKGVAGTTVTLKLKTAGFRSITRQTALESPVNLAGTLHAAVARLLPGVLAEGPFRLAGVGLSGLVEDGGESPARLFDDGATARERAERATDVLRARFGPDAIQRGRALR